MFQEIGRQGDVAEQRSAELEILDAQALVIAAHRKEQTVDGANQVAEENKSYLYTLRELGQAIGFSAVVQGLYDNTRNTPNMKRFRPHTADISWLPNPRTMTDEYGSPKDGIRAIYGWRTHWQNLSKNRPLEAAVVLFSQQHKGEVLPPQATVIGFDTHMDQKGSQQFTDRLKEGSYFFNQYVALRKIGEKPYDDLAEMQRKTFITGAYGLIGALRDDPKTLYPEPNFKFFRREAYKYLNQSDIEPQQEHNNWLEALVEAGETAEFTALYQQLGYAEQFDRFPLYTTAQLSGVNSYFRQPVTRQTFLGYRLDEGRTWRDSIARWAKTEELEAASPAIQNAWLLPDASVLNPVLERERIAERWERILLNQNAVAYSGI